MNFVHRLAGPGGIAVALAENNLGLYLGLLKINLMQAAGLMNHPSLPTLTRGQSTDDMED